MVDEALLRCTDHMAVLQVYLYWVHTGGIHLSPRDLCSAPGSHAERRRWGELLFILIKSQSEITARELCCSDPSLERVMGSYCCHLNATQMERRSKSTLE